jgi:hypothetical protein
VKDSMDESIFVWKYLGPSRCSHTETHGLLAVWPCCFAESANLTIKNKKKYKARMQYQWTKGGIEFNIPHLLPLGGANTSHNGVYTPFRRNYGLALNCWTTDRRSDDTMVIALEKRNGQWRKVKCDEWIFTSSVRSSNNILTGPKFAPIHIPQTGFEAHI